MQVRCVSCGKIDTPEEFNEQRGSERITVCPRCCSYDEPEEVEVCPNCQEVIEKGQEHEHEQECEEHGWFCGHYPAGCPECNEQRINQW